MAGREIQGMFRSRSTVLVGMILWSGTEYFPVLLDPRIVPILLYNLSIMYLLYNLRVAIGMGNNDWEI